MARPFVNLPRYGISQLHPHKLLKGVGRRGSTGSRTDTCCCQISQVLIAQFVEDIKQQNTSREEFCTQHLNRRDDKTAIKKVVPLLARGF